MFPKSVRTAWCCWKTEGTAGCWRTGACEWVAVRCLLRRLHPSSVITLRALMIQESSSSLQHPKIGCLSDVFASFSPYTQSSVYVWRADHVPLIPKLAVREIHFQETPVMLNGEIYDHRTCIQLVPTCLTESPVYECVACLQRVEKLTADGDWKETELDRNQTRSQI